MKTYSSQTRQQISQLCQTIKDRADNDPTADVDTMLKQLIDGARLIQVEALVRPSPAGGATRLGRLIDASARTRSREWDKITQSWR